MNRREFLGVTSSIAAMAAVPGVLSAAGQGGSARGRLMKVALTPGSIGVTVKTQAELNDLAHRHKYEAVEPRGDELAGMSAGQLQATLADLKAKNLVWAAAGLPVDFRAAEDLFRKGMTGLPRIAAGLQRAGVTRVGTWLTPNSDTLTYRQHFQQTTARLREIGTVLKDHGLRLGLEYVGTQRSLVSRRYPFVHTLAETRELIAEAGTGNLGLVLDTWHWWTAGDTADDIRTLTNADVVSVDLNDAPANIEKRDQRDNQRELPMATGVIDVAAFLNALHAIGYDGPVRPEPFNQAVNAMENDEACAVASAALHGAMDKLARA
jgi:sugar phosphate isomerase/epimerase